MPSKIERTSEYEMSLAVLGYLRHQPYGEASQEELRAAIPHYIDLTNGDMEDSPSRPGEQRWEQIMRNIQSHHANRRNAGNRTSHHANPNNFVSLGYLEHVPGGGLRITAEGHEFISKLDAS